MYNFGCFEVGDVMVHYNDTHVSKGRVDQMICDLAREMARQGKLLEVLALAEQARGLVAMEDKPRGRKVVKIDGPRFCPQRRWITGIPIGDWRCSCNDDECPNDKLFPDWCPQDNAP